MPRHSEGPHLYLREARRDAKGKLTHRPVYLIRDGGKQRSTGYGKGSFGPAQQALADYIKSKRESGLGRGGSKDPSSILVSDVVTLYTRDIVEQRHSRPDETKARLNKILDFFAHANLAEVTGAMCRDYIKARTSRAWKSSNPNRPDRIGTVAAARRELEDLRAAINHHRREGLHDKIVSVALPLKSLPRERWLTREEAAALILAAWRYREQQNFRGTDRRTRRHIAKFILVALYSGSRAGVVCSAAFKREPGRAWIDVDRGVLHRRPERTRETKKRRPPVRLPDELIAHLRRWRNLGQRYAVEWNGRPVTRIHRAFNAVVCDAGLGSDVVPHTLRHTAATWQMQAGTDLWQAAGFLGMTVQTLEANYGHHHPEHQGEARRAFRRLDRHSTATDKREQKGPTKVEKPQKPQENQRPV